MRQGRFFIGSFLVLGLIMAGCGPDPFSRGEVLPQENGETGSTTEAPAETGQTGTTETTGNTVTTEIAVSYTLDVYPILEEKCSPCHGEGRAASSTRYVLTGDPAEDYDTIVALVDPEAPEESLLVQKGSGAVTHGGGQQLDEAEVTLIVSWVAQGAPNN